MGDARPLRKLRRCVELRAGRPVAQRRGRLGRLSAKEQLPTRQRLPQLGRRIRVEGRIRQRPQCPVALLFQHLPVVDPDDPIPLQSIREIFSLPLVEGKQPDVVESMPELMKGNRREINRAGRRVPRPKMPVVSLAVHVDDDVGLLWTGIFPHNRVSKSIAYNVVDFPVTRRVNPIEIVRPGRGQHPGTERLVGRVHLYGHRGRDVGLPDVDGPLKGLPGLRREIGAVVDLDCRGGLLAPLRRGPVTHEGIDRSLAKPAVLVPLRTQDLLVRDGIAQNSGGLLGERDRRAENKPPCSDDEADQ